MADGFFDNANEEDRNFAFQVKRPPDMDAARQAMFMAEVELKLKSMRTV